MILRLDGEADTLALGRALAQAMTQAGGAHGPWPALLLDGDLGAGKTTLVRGLVAALPGGEAAEVSSPSFNLVNHYPTTPPVAHFDLYRLEGLPPGEDFHDCADDPGLFLVVEWSGHLGPAHRPGDALTLAWRRAGAGREVEVRAEGPRARAALFGLAGLAGGAASGQMPAESPSNR